MQLIELPLAYKFSDKNGFTLPAGLVAIRPLTDPKNILLGSFETKTKSTSGTHPMVIVVLSCQSEKRAQVIYATKSATDKNVGFWRTVNASIVGSQIYIPSWRDGSDDLLVELKTANQGKFTQTPDKYSQLRGDKIGFHFRRI